MEKKYDIFRRVLGRSIHACVTVLDDGVHVLITGGSLTHIGAVSIWDESGCLKAIEIPNHKDRAVSDMAARRLSKEFSCKVTVSAGIHYDNITRIQIEEILLNVDGMIDDIIEELKNNEGNNF